LACCRTPRRHHPAERHLQPAGRSIRLPRSRVEGQGPPVARQSARAVRWACDRPWFCTPWCGGCGRTWRWWHHAQVSLLRRGAHRPGEASRRPSGRSSAIAPPQFPRGTSAGTSQDTRHDTARPDWI
jgi:hypothetical protein